MVWLGMSCMKALKLSIFSNLGKVLHYPWFTFPVAATLPLACKSVLAEVSLVYFREFWLGVAGLQFRQDTSSWRMSLIYRPTDFVGQRSLSHTKGIEGAQTFKQNHSKNVWFLQWAALSGQAP